MFLQWVYQPVVNPHLTASPMEKHQMPTATLSAPAHQPIRPDETYHLADFLARTRWKRWAFRSARRNGLPVLKIGNQHFVRGQDFLSYLDRAAAK